MIGAIRFDLDGTLIDTEPAAAVICARFTLRMYGVQVGIYAYLADALYQIQNGANSTS
jgi:beta-phosphoglucomutase-like phosphatase (HAD superfamily)